MIVSVLREIDWRRGKWGREKKNTRGSKCNVTADPSAFRHGHFHFHHADPTPITLPGAGEAREQAKPVEEAHPAEDVAKVK